VRVDAEDIEEQVRWFVSFTTFWQKSGEQPEDATVLAAERSRLQARRNEVADAFADGVLDRDQARRANERIAEAGSALDERARSLGSAEMVDAEPYDREDFGAWRRLIERRIERVTVREDGSAVALTTRGGEEVQLSELRAAKPKPRPRKTSKK
jgi:hypothetical protein